MPRRAKDTPVLTSNVIETQEQPLGHTVRKTNETSQAGEPQLVAVAERLPDPEKVAMLAFMNESVTIRPTRTSDPKETVFEITVNGRIFPFRVGQDATVPRYVADHMARMKTTSYVDKEVFNAEGIKQIQHIPTTVLKYDFAMVHDANPMGAAWLKATLAMAG